MNTEFHTEFLYQVTLDYEPGITRRDSSPVIKADGTYYVWYSKSTIDDTIIIELQTQGKLNLKGIITHTVPFKEASKAFKLIDKHPEECIQVVLSY